MDVLLNALLGRRLGRQQITSVHRHGDNGAFLLHRLSKLKRHLSEKMSIVCWLGSIPHTSGKVVNFNTCIIFFWFFLPQMIHYMTVNEEPGFEWSPMPLHMHTSIAQPPHPPTTHPPASFAQDTRDLQSCAQPLMSEMTQSSGL